MTPRQLPTKPMPLALDTELGTPMAEDYSNAKPSTSVDMQPVNPMAMNHAICTKLMDEVSSSVLTRDF